MANYWVNLKGHNDTHPTKGVLKECWENNTCQRDNFGRVGNDVAEECGVSEMRKSPIVIYPKVAPWKLEWPDVDWHVLEVKRKGKGQIDLVNVFEHHIIEKCSGFIQVYTDGVKEPETGLTGIEVAVPAKGIGINRRTSDKLGVYTLEIIALLVALRWVESSRLNKVVICSDASSVLASLRSFHSNSRQDVLYEVLQSITRIVNQGGQITFLWVPACEGGGEGGERVDRLAKEALKKGNIEMQISISETEVKCVIWQVTVQMWQEKWDREERGRQLYQIQKSVNETRACSGYRREEIVRICVFSVVSALV